MKDEIFNATILIIKSSILLRVSLIPDECKMYISGDLIFIGHVLKIPGDPIYRSCSLDIR